MTLVRDALRGYTCRLDEAKVDSPRLSAEMLLAHAMGADRVRLIMDAALPLTVAELVRAEHFISRRAKGEPTAYILGSKEFYGLDFVVTPATLIPRPETEHIIEQAEQFFDTNSPLRFLDLGTGSGALAVTLAVRFPKATGKALDLSEEALSVARGNAKHHGVAQRVEFLQADFTSSLPGAELDLVVCNPPYVSEQEYATLSPEVAVFEPKLALVSPGHGLELIERMLPMASQALRPGGVLLLEIGYDQGARVLRLLSDESLGFEKSVITCDLAGLERVVSAQKRG